MKEYLLFVDTETSGIPKDWNKPYSEAGNWPYIVQIAWVVFTKDGKEVKSENHYIKSNDYTISDVSRRIHGITEDFLQTHGKERKAVMQLLHHDLLEFQPLVISHFAQLDFHMVGLGFYRAGLTNPLLNLPTFCTMTLTHNFKISPFQKQLRLGELYQRLFSLSLENQHDALVDARATAKCFFKLKDNGDIDDGIIKRQQIDERPSYELGKKPNLKKNIIYVIGILLSVIVIYLIIAR